MGANREYVDNLKALAKKHDDLAASKGWKADRDTDRALGRYLGARAFATQEELDQADGKK